MRAMPFTNRFVIGKLSVILLLTLAVIAPSGHADDWSDIYKKTKAKYAKYQNDIKDITIHQEITIVTPQREIKSESKMMKKGNMYRMETTVNLPEMPKEMAPMKMLVIHEGEDAWMISSMMGKHKIIGAEKKQYEMAGDWWVFLPEKALSVGSESIGNYDCHMVEFEGDQAGPYSKIWIDKKDLVLIKAESAMPDGKTVVLTCSDFRKYEKEWKLPYKTEITMDGALISTVFVKSIEINKNLSDDLFDHDKAEVTGPSMEQMMKMMQEE
jgi:outer membrane lipoprotein-sorting protein